MVFSTETASHTNTSDSCSLDSARDVEVLLKTIPWQSVISDVMIAVQIEEVGV